MDMQIHESNLNAMELCYLYVFCNNLMRSIHNNSLQTTILLKIRELEWMSKTRTFGYPVDIHWICMCCVSMCIMIIMSRNSKAIGKQRFYFHVISPMLAALIAMHTYGQCTSNTTAHQQINENGRKSMIELVCIIKEYFHGYTYVSLNVNDQPGKEIIGNVSKSNEEILMSFYHMLTMKDNSSLHNEVITPSWRNPYNEGGRKNVQRERNMVDVNVRVTTLYNPPMSMLKSNGSEKVLTGYIGDIWHDIQDILKFSYSVYSSEEDQFNSHYSGCCQPNEGKIECNTANCGTWVNLVRQLTRDQVDVVATPLTPTLGRVLAIHFSSPILFSSEQLFIRLRSKAPVSYEFYLQPFSSNIWFMIAIIFMCILPMMHTLISWLSPNQSLLNIPSDFQDGMVHKNNQDLSLASKFVDAISHWVIESCGICCQQGLQYMPLSEALKISLYVTMLTSGVIYNIYSGSLTSFLAVDRQLKPQFSSMENLLQSAKHSGLSIGVLENSSLISILSEQSSGPYKEIWDIISDSESGLVPTRFEGFQRACADNYVFFTLKASYEGYRKFLQPCELYGISEPNLDTYVGISMAKDYKYAGLIDDMLLRMNEVGMLHRQRLKWWPPYRPEEYTYAAAQKDAVETGTSDPIMKITLRHVTFAINLLVTGIMLSLIIFLCEKLFTCHGWCINL